MNGGRRARRDPPRWLGHLALLFYALNAVYHLRDGDPDNMLWACHLGALLVGVGMVLRKPMVNLIGILWLSVGTPLWLYNLFGGGEFFWTSTLTHLGGLAIGIFGARSLGEVDPVWWKALVLLVPLHVLSRWITSEERNTNFAHRVWPGMEGLFRTHFGFLLAVAVLCAGLFLAVEWVLRRYVIRSQDRGGSGLV